MRWRRLLSMQNVRLSEDDWMGMVTQLAQLKGWDWFHVRPAMKRGARLWVTPVAGTLGMGWPDLVLVKHGRPILWVELKAESGALTEDQKRVHEVLRSAQQDVQVWRPPDWPRVVEALS